MDKFAIDRPIPQDTLRNESLKRYMKIGGITIAVIIALYYVYSLFALSVEGSMLRIARVDRGVVESVINATGTILPEFEQVMSSPIDTRILKVMRRPGDSLRAGEPIMLLDVDYVRISIRKSNDQLALKSNALAQLKATYDGQLIKQRNQLRNKKLELEQKKNVFEQQQMLYEQHAISKNDFLTAKLAYEQLKNDCQEIDSTLTSLAESTKLQREGLNLEISILRSELELFEQQLRLADMRSNQNGILTWVLTTEGASIQKGGVLAKVADLNSYRLEAKVSEIHAANVSVGMTVRVKISRSGQEVFLDGEVSNISPSVENGIMSIQAKLLQPNHEALRPNQRVDVYLIQDRKENVLRLRKPMFASTEGRSEVFVVRGDEAVKTLIEVGLRGADVVEVSGGLSEGDEVIISDMNDYKHANVVKIDK